MKIEFLRRIKMRRLILTSILALSTLIIGCAPANVKVTTPGNADENNVKMSSPAEHEENGNWDAYYNEGMGY